MIDKNGRLFGKVSVLDISIVLLFVAMFVGFIMRGGTATAAQIINANQEFDIIFAVDRVRDFSVNAVNVGDIFFEQNASIIGNVIETWTVDSKDLVRLDNGTIVEMDVQERFNLFVKIRATGFVSENTGYFINGSRHIAKGQFIRVQSNNIFTAMSVREILPVN